MTTKVQKWGNSLAIRLPKELAGRLKLTVGTAVDILGGSTKIEIKPIKIGRPTLRELLDKITPENIHPETDWGRPVGKEVW